MIFDDSSMAEVIRSIVEGELSSKESSHACLLAMSGKLEGWQELVTGRIGLQSIVERGFEELLNHKDKHVKILVSPRERRTG